jgi:hypothetical protein
MIDSVDPVSLDARLRELDAKIRALKVRRQYANGTRYGLILDEHMAALSAERADVIDALSRGSRCASGAVTGDRRAVPVGPAVRTARR